jgi:hypothetical protein
MISTPAAYAAVLQVPASDRRVLLVKLEAREPTAVGQPAGDRDRAVAGERPELERTTRADQPREHGQ